MGLTRASATLRARLGASAAATRWVSKTAMPHVTTVVLGEQTRCLRNSKESSRVASMPALPAVPGALANVIVDAVATRPTGRHTWVQTRRQNPST